MTLKDWMEREGVTAQTLAPLVGVEVALVRSWASGRVMPDHSQRLHVAHATKGAVTMADWTDRAQVARGARP